jgi:hypothetical protein
MINNFSFEHNGEWHYSTEPEQDAKIRQKKWEFLRTHNVKYFYETNEELMTSARTCGLLLTNQEKTK